MRSLLLLLPSALAAALLSIASSTPVTALVAPASPVRQAAPPAAGPSTLLQANLCLSGYASCWSRAGYPAVVDEVAAAVADQRPAAVTLNETCSGDSAALARRTGLHLRFSAVLVGGVPLDCRAPAGRGVFGVAVLTRDPVAAATSRGFARHAGLEGRRWLCVTTERAVTVCTAHLGTRGSAGERRVNDAECGELRAVLRGYDARGRTLFGGDVNRHRSCAPSTMWGMRDSAAGQLRGIQQVYGSRSWGRAAARVVAAHHTDHDFLSVATEGQAGTPGVE